MEKYIDEIFEEMREAQNKFFAESPSKIIEISIIISKTFLSGGKLLIFGNGGSASDAQHIAAEFVNRFKMERPPLPAIALTTDTSILTSIGNDYSFDDIYLKQVSALASDKDLIIGISTSGNSENVIRALRGAARSGIKTIGFTGKEGGKMNGLCDILYKVDADATARIQEIHIQTLHIICALVDEMMFGKFAGNIQ